MTMDLYCHVREETLFTEVEKMEQKCALIQNGVKWCSKANSI
jgi:hypothetical protein